MTIKARGYTFVEVIVVAAIVGVLAASALSYFSDSIGTARENATRQSLANMRQSIAAYFKTNLEYPTSFKKIGLGAPPSKVILERLGDPDAQIYVLVPKAGAIASNPVQLDAASLEYKALGHGSFEFLGDDGKAAQFSDIKVLNQSGLSGLYGNW